MAPVYGLAFVALHIAALFTLPFLPAVFALGLVAVVIGGGWFLAACVQLSMATYLPESVSEKKKIWLSFFLGFYFCVSTPLYDGLFKLPLSSLQIWFFSSLILFNCLDVYRPFGTPIGRLKPMMTNVRTFYHSALFSFYLAFGALLTAFFQSAGWVVLTLNVPWSPYYFVAVICLMSGLGFAMYYRMLHFRESLFWRKTEQEVSVE